MAACRVGVSGWQYDGWNGDFYPRELPRRRHLEYVTRLFGTVEVNGTFYSLKSPAAYERWAATSAEDAVFAIKGSRYITHKLRLREVDTAMANFFANGLLRLEGKLGPLLWQLPPRMPWEPEAFRRFCEMLPRSTAEAARLAKHHDARVEGKSSLEPGPDREIRHAFEIRDRRMLNEELILLLREYRFALVFADTAGKHPFAEDVTADFLYLRLHGAEELYASGYQLAQLQDWARRIAHWQTGHPADPGRRVVGRSPASRRRRDVYVYFDNDAKVHAPFDAIVMARLLGRALDPMNLEDDEGQPLPPPPRLSKDRGPPTRPLDRLEGARMQGSM